MNRYRFVKQLGDGTYGSVILATMLDTEEKVAIKRMKKKYYSWEECLNLREVKSLRKLNHINIVKLKEVIRENDMLYFVFEYMKENLYQMVKDRDKVFPESTVRNIMYQVLQGLAFMHKHGFFHRDLKPENLLCSGPELVKIADFGLAREIRSRPPYTDYVSTRWYRAPEVLLRSTQYSSPIDIWAVGSIMAEVYTLRPLFPGSSEIDQLFKVTSVLGTPSKSEWPEGHKLAAAMNFKWPTMVPTPLKQLIPSAGPEGLELMRLSMLWDPQKRPSAAAVLRHNYFKVGQNLGSKVTTPSHRPSNAPPVEPLANHKPMYRAPVKAVHTHEQENKPPSGSMYKPAAQPKPHVKKDPFALSIKKSGRKRWGVSDSTDDWGDDLEASFSLSKKPAAGHHHVTKPSYAPPPPKKDDDFEDILASKNFGGGNAKPVLPKIQNNRVNSGRSSASSAKQVYMSKSRYMPGKNPLGSGKKDSATSNWGSPINKPANIGGMNLNRTNAPIGGSTFNAGSNAGNNYVPSFGGSASKNNNFRPGGWKRAEPAPLSLNNPSANRQPVKVTGRTDWASKYLKS